jgi:hypothetical protein
MEEFVSLGEWWLPNNPEVVVAGKLSFSPNSGAKLELLGSFYDSPFEETGKVKDLPSADKILLSEESRITEETPTFDLKTPEEPIILGFLEKNNEKITLYKCLGSIKTLQLIERANFVFEATYVFREIHFETEQEIKFNSISIRYHNFEEWVGKSGVEAMWSREENKIWISYQPPSNIPIGKFEEIDLSISFSQIYINPSFERYFRTTSYKRSIEQKTFFTLNNPQKQSIDKCFEKIIYFRDFLTFAMSKPSSVSAITGNVDITYEKPILKDDGSYYFEEVIWASQVKILFAFGNSGQNSETNVFPHEMLFVYNEIEENLGEIFKQWLHKKETYESVFDLFMITMYTSNLYLHYHFLNIIQALEVYHRIRYRKKDANLNPRLTELLKDITHLLPDNFIGGKNDRESFIKKAVDSRNALTHHSKKERLAKSEELAKLFYTLKVMLQSCLLLELGLTNESIKKLIERNRNYQKEWRLPN